MAPEGAVVNLEVYPLIRDLVLLAVAQGISNLVLLGLLLGNRKTRNELLNHVGDLVKTVAVSKLATKRGPAEVVTAIRSLAPRAQAPPPEAPDQPDEPEEPPGGMTIRGGL